MEQGDLPKQFQAVATELMQFLRARGMSTEDAEDLLQDLFVKLETVDLRNIAEARAYFYRMANNLAHDRRRAEQSRRKRNEAWQAKQTGARDEETPSWNTERVLQQRDHLRRVEALLDELPERTSAIFWRYRVEGESQKAIANSLGISLSAVEKHLQRAYRAVLDLKHRLENPVEGPAQELDKGGPDARSR